MHKQSPQKILLTGATGGIGQAIVRSLAPACRHLFIVGRNELALEHLAAQFEPGRVIPLCGDVTDTAFIKQALAQVASAGGLDLLINNAGIGDFGKLENQDPEQMAQILQVNLLAPSLWTQAALPLLRQAVAAQIINVGSTFAYLGYPGQAIYSASKFGLRGLTEALSRELAESQVRVRFFSPRATKTSLNSPQVQDLNLQLGVAQDCPEQVARELVTFLAGNAQELQLGYPEKVFAKLNQIFPALVSRGLRKQLPTIDRALNKLNLQTQRVNT